MYVLFIILYVFLHNYGRNDVHLSCDEWTQASRISWFFKEPVCHTAEPGMLTLKPAASILFVTFIKSHVWKEIIKVGIVDLFEVFSLPFDRSKTVPGNHNNAEEVGFTGSDGQVNSQTFYLARRFLLKHWLN